MKTKLALVILALTFLAAVVLAGGCSQQIEKPTQTDRVEGAPEIPRNLQTKIGDGEVVLSWEIADASKILRYLIYRGDTTGTQTEVIDSTSELSYTDSNLRNSLRYIYQVAAIGNNTLESKRSSAVSATPNTFSVSIGDGARYTKIVDVTLNLAAPTGTRLVQLGNDSQFVGATWQNYSSSRSWRLTPGDGVKYVYGRFRDGEGNETSRFYSDDIILDSRSNIISVTENSDGKVLKAGDVVHFALVTDETEGVATVAVSGLGTITLYNDDPSAIQPTYEADYVIPGAADVIDGTVTGNFTDAAGNQAPARVALTYLNIANPPQPAQLSSFAVSETEMSITWTKSSATDFASYMLFRSTGAGVDSTSTLVKTETNSSTTSFGDTDLKVGITYFYALYTVDKSALMAKSNVIAAQTVDNPPAAVTLSVFVVSESEVELDWSRSTATDFASYQLFRSDDANVDSTSTLLQTQTSSTTTTYRDIDRKPETAYSYAVYTVDRAGSAAKSNIISVTTAVNLRPDSVTLFISKRDSIPASVTLGWTKNDDKDFESYRVYRSDAPGSSSTGKLIAAVTAQSTTQYVDNSIAKGNTYYFTVIVYDKYGMPSKVSNEVTSVPN
jgi:fibronectin type 3 domain-containing protein